MVRIEIDSPSVRYSAEHIEADYVYSTSEVKVDENVYRVRPRDVRMTFRTRRKVPRLGVMLVGWGGNNGTTVTAAVLANRLGLSWRTKDKTQVHASLADALRYSTHLNSSKRTNEKLVGRKRDRPFVIISLHRVVWKMFLMRPCGQSAKR